MLGALLPLLTDDGVFVVEDINGFYPFLEGCELSPCYVARHLFHPMQKCVCICGTTQEAMMRFSLSSSASSPSTSAAALPLFATGLGALGLLGWRRKRKALAA